jgi:hypothetical protein
MSTQSPTELAAVIVHFADMLALSSLDISIDQQELAATVRNIREARGLLANAERAFEAKLAEQMTSKVSEDGTYERRWSPDKTTWDHDFIAPRIVAASMDERILNPDTGEIESEGSAVMRLFREAAGISYWRVGALKRLGINIDDCREQLGGRYIIRFL